MIIILLVGIQKAWKDNLEYSLMEQVRVKNLIWEIVKWMNLEEIIEGFKKILIIIAILVSLEEELYYE